MVGNGLRMSYKCTIIGRCYPSVMWCGVRYGYSVSGVYGCGGGLRCVRGGGVRRPPMSSFHTSGHSGGGVVMGFIRGVLFGYL